MFLDVRRHRVSLYSAGNCRYDPPRTAPAYPLDLCDEYLET